MLLRLFLSVYVLGSVTSKPAKSEASTSDIQSGNEPGVNKHFDFSDFLGNIFGGQPGGQSFYPNTGNGQMNGQQQQYPNQYPNQNQQNNQNQWQNQPPGNNNFGYPNQGNNGAFNNNQNPWQISGIQQYPNNPGSGQNNNQGQGQNPDSGTNKLDWKNLYPSLTFNQPPSQNNNNPQTQNPQFNQQWPNQGSNQFQNPGNSPGQPVQTPYVNPNNPQQWQNSGQAPINGGQNQFPSGGTSNGPQQWQNSGQGSINAGQNQNPNVNENMPEDGTIDSIIPGQGITEAPPNQASSTDMTPTLCQQNCPSTAEYNPVCGNDNVTYNNPGSLLCARNCGLSVRLNHRGRCSGDPANRFMG